MHGTQLMQCYSNNSLRRHNQRRRVEKFDNKKHSSTKTETIVKIENE